MSYNSNTLEMHINDLIRRYPFLQVGSIGRTVLYKEIPYIKIGRGKKEVFYNASFHANEWITTPILMKFIENFSLAYAGNSTIYEYNASEIFNNVSMYIVPMVNLDGVDLVTGAMGKDTLAYRQALEIANNYPEVPFPNGWKANINGVDLNSQFPAGWENAKNIKFNNGFISPAPRDYVGTVPLTQPESYAVYQFTLEHDFSLTLSYHTQGKEVYWQFQNYAPQGAFEIGKKFANVSGYTLSEAPYESSFAGYKDWYLQTYRRPGYTIEAGLGENPISMSQFDEIYKNNEGILVLGAILS